MTHVAGRRFLDVHTSSSAGGGGDGGAGLRVEETTDMGEKYVVDVTTGEKFIRGSRRPDGTYRKDIRVRSDYVPLDERRAFQTRQQISRSERATPSGGGTGTGFPPGYSGPPPPIPASSSRKSKARGAGASTSPVASISPIAAAGDGTEGGGKRSSHRGKKKTSGGISEETIGSVSPVSSAQRPQKNMKQRTISNEGNTFDSAVPAAGVDDLVNQLTNEVKNKLRLAGEEASTAGQNSSSTSSYSGNNNKVTEGDKPRHEVEEVDDEVGVAEELKTPEEIRKRIRDVKKKLEEVGALEAKLVAGVSISEKQKQKIQRAGPLKKELKALEKLLHMTEVK